MKVLALKRSAKQAAPELILSEYGERPTKKGRVEDLFQMLSLSPFGRQFGVLKRMEPSQILKKCELLEEFRGEAQSKIRKKELSEILMRHRQVRFGKVESNELRLEEEQPEDIEEHEFYYLFEGEHECGPDTEHLFVESKALYPCLSPNEQGQLVPYYFEDPEQEDSVDSNHEDFEGNQYPQSSEEEYEEEWTCRGLRKRRKRSFDFEQDF